MKGDKFYYPVDFVVLDTESVAEGIHQVPIILRRPFIIRSLELNIFHLTYKHQSAEDEKQNSNEVSLTSTSVEENSAQELQKELMMDNEAFNEKLTTPSLLLQQ